MIDWIKNWSPYSWLIFVITLFVCGVGGAVLGNTLLAMAWGLVIGMIGGRFIVEMEKSL